MLSAICCTLFLFPPLINDCFVFSLLVLWLSLSFPSSVSLLYFYSDAASSPLLPPPTSSVCSLGGVSFQLNRCCFQHTKLFFFSPHLLLFCCCCCCCPLDCFLPNCFLNTPCILLPECAEIVQSTPIWTWVCITGNCPGFSRLFYFYRDF